MTNKYFKVKISISNLLNKTFKFFQMPQSKIEKAIEQTPLENRTNWPDAMTLLDLDRKMIDVTLCKLENCEDFIQRGIFQRYYDMEH